ncbi:PspC domain-containing protein [Solidesulfovibrio sp.]
MRRCNRQFPRRGLYRSRRGMALGVCRGLAEYLGLPVLVVRAFTVVVFVTTGFVAVLGYLACGVLMRLEPLDEAPSGGLHRAAGDIARRAGDLDARIARMESHVTSREYDFDRRLRRS